MVLSRNACLHPVALPFVSGSSLPLFRCGKCAACLKHKGNALSVRLYREVECKGKVHFLTFTYNNKSLPIRTFDYKVNEDTGEILGTSIPFWTSDGEYFYKHCPFEYKLNKNGKRTKRCFPLIEDVSSVFNAYTTYRVKYFSLRVKDLQDAIKRFRANTGLTHKDFKYFVVPEYGSVGYRPHYHMCVVGLDNLQIEKLVEEWSFGNVDVRCVSATAKDRTKQLSKLSAYVSKYACKGKFDCPYIKTGECLPPRRCSSIRFGFGTKKMYEDLKRYLLAFDVFGEYDYKTIDPTDDMVKVIASRRYYDVNGYTYPLPDNFTREFFKVKTKIYDSMSFSLKNFVADAIHRICDIRPFQLVPYIYHYHSVNDPITLFYEKNPRISFKSTPLQTKVANFVLHRLCEDAQREQEDLFKTAENLGMSYSELLSIRKSEQLLREKSFETSFKSSLLNSIF